MKTPRNPISELLKTILQTVCSFIQCCVFWALALGVAAALDLLGAPVLPQDWFMPTYPLVVALGIGAITLVLEISILSSKKHFRSLLSKAFLYLLRSCNASIGSVSLNAAAIYFLMMITAPERMQGGTTVVMFGIVIGWLDFALRHRSLVMARTSHQT